MSKYIKDFKETGVSIINVDSVCNDWNDRFSISTWINKEEEKYIFVVNGKRKNTRICKTQISKEQVFEIVSNLNLIHVKDATFKSAGVYRTKDFIKSEIDRITEIKLEKEQELTFIRHTLYNYESYL